MEVLRRRDKRKEPCISDWKNFDEHIMSHTVKKIDCRAPYQTQLLADLPICTGKHRMRQALIDARSSLTKSFSPPCVAMTNIQDSYNEVDVSKGRKRQLVLD